MKILSTCEFRLGCRLLLTDMRSNLNVEQFIFDGKDVTLGWPQKFVVFVQSKEVQRNSDKGIKDQSPAGRWWRWAGEELKVKERANRQKQEGYISVSYGSEIWPWGLARCRGPCSEFKRRNKPVRRSTSSQHPKRSPNSSSAPKSPLRVHRSPIPCTARCRRNS